MPHSAFWLAIIATTIVSLTSLVGLVVLFRERFVKKVILWLVAFSAGTMLGAGFLHLVPEALKTLTVQPVFLFVILGFLLFYMVERLLHWSHCHEIDGECQVHTFAYMSLFGDAIHNFMDGLLIATSFVANPLLGWTTTWAIASHELPQEIGHFGILIHSGMSRGKAAWLNFITALTAILGTIVGYWLSSINGLVGPLLGITAGGFFYISAVDLVPEVHEKTGSRLSKNALHFFFFVLGIIFMFLVKD